jgi:hypothetical protein
VKIITLDAETYFDAEYTLKKLTTEAYIRDSRFEVHGWGVRHSAGQLEWMTHAQFAARKCEVEWGEAAILCHHAQFDGLILSHHYGIKPALWLDTLSMARLMLGNHVSVSLASLAKHYGLSEKNVPYDQFVGRHWQDLDPYTQKLVADGCLRDVELTWRIFCKLMRDVGENQCER